MSEYVPLVTALGASVPYDRVGLDDLNTPYQWEQVPTLQMGPGQSFWFLTILPDGQVAIPSQPLTTNAFQPTGTDLELLVYNPDAKVAQKIVVPTSTGSTHPIANIAGGQVGGSDFEDGQVMARSTGEQVLVCSSGRPFNFWDAAVDGVYPVLAVFRAQPDGTWAYSASFSKTAAQLAASGTATSHGLFPVVSWLGTNVTTNRNTSEIEAFPRSGHLLVAHYDNDVANGHNSGGFSVYDKDLVRLLEVQLPEVTHPDGGLLHLAPRDLTVDPSSQGGNEIFNVIYDTFNAVTTTGTERLSAGQTGGSSFGWVGTSATVSQDATHGVGGSTSVQVAAAFAATAEINLQPGVGRDADSGNLIAPPSNGLVSSASDITHWANTAATLAFVSGKGLRVTTLSAGLGGATLDASSTSLQNIIAAHPGRVARLTVTCEAVATSRFCQVGVRFYNSGGTRNGSTFVTQATKDPVGSGQTYVVDVLVPSTAVYMAGAVTFGVASTDVPASGEQHYIRNMTVNEIPSGYRVEPGVPYQISVSALAATTGRFIRPEITFVDQNGLFLRQDRMAAVTKDTTSGQTTVTFTSSAAPNGAWWGYIGVFIGGTTDIPVSGEVHYISAPSFKVAAGTANRLFCSQVWKYDSAGPTLTPLSAPFFSDDRYRMQVAGFAPNGDLWVSTTLPGGLLQGPLCVWTKQNGVPSIVTAAPANAGWIANTATSQWGVEDVPDVKISGLTGGYLMNIPFDKFTDTAWLPDQGHSATNGTQPVERKVNADGSVTYLPGTKIDLHSYDLFPPTEPWLFAKAAIDSTRRRLFYPARGVSNLTYPYAPYQVDSWLYQIDLVPAPSLHIRTNQTTLDLLNLTDLSMRRESVRFDILDANLGYLRTVHPIRPGASVGWDSTSTVKRRLDGFHLTPFDAELVDVFNERVQPVWVLENGVEFPVGVFMFSDSNRHVATYGVDLQGTLYDQTPLVDQARPYSFSVNVGDSLRDAMLQIIAECNLPSYVLDPFNAFVGNPASWPSGTSRYTILTDLAKAANCYPPFFTNDGALRVKSIPDDIVDQEPDFVYDDSGSTMIRDTIIQSEDLVSAPNRYVVISSGATDTDIVGVYDLPDYAPMSAFNRGGLVIASVENAQGVPDVATAVARARGNAAADFSAGIWYEFDAVADPRHDGFQLCRVLGQVTRETSWNLKLAPGGPVSLSERAVY